MRVSLKVRGLLRNVSLLDGSLNEPTKYTQKINLRLHANQLFLKESYIVLRNDALALNLSSNRNHVCITPHKRSHKNFGAKYKKVRGNRNTSSNLTSHEFLEHFKNLCSSEENIFVNEDTERELELLNVDQLDCNFSIHEVEKAIGCLKRGKSSGEDSLIPEIFIETKSIFSPILCRLFNYIFNNSIYPECWTRGIIVPVPKKGSLNDINNYRGITLTSVFSKLFSLILDNRIRKWAEEIEILYNCQLGFREKRSTVDCIFVLTLIINKFLFCEKKEEEIVLRFC